MGAKVGEAVLYLLVVLTRYTQRHHVPPNVAHGGAMLGMQFNSTAECDGPQLTGAQLAVLLTVLASLC